MQLESQLVSVGLIRTPLAELPMATLTQVGWSTRRFSALNVAPSVAPNLCAILKFSIRISCVPRLRKRSLKPALGEPSAARKVTLLWENKVRPKTVKYYQYGCKLLLDSDLANLRLDAITDEHAARFAAHCSHLSVATINAALRTLRRIIYLAVDWKRMDRKPKLSLTKGEKIRERILVPEEIDLYLSSCPQPWKDAATIMLNTALRPDEIFRLRRENVNFEGRGAISITEGKSRAARRTLPMTPEVRRILMERSELPGEWIFPSASKVGHYNQGSAKKHHTLALERSGVQPCAPYTLRHTALTFFGKFLDPFTLARVAGHSAISMTSRYVHPDSDSIQEGFDRVTEAGYMNHTLPETAEKSIQK
jgi:integrase